MQLASRFASRSASSLSSAAGLAASRVVVLPFDPKQTFASCLAGVRLYAACWPYSGPLRWGGMNGVRLRQGRGG